MFKLGLSAFPSQSISRELLPPPVPQWVIESLAAAAPDFPLTLRNQEREQKAEAPRARAGAAAPALQ